MKIVVGSVIAAVAASACCIGPVVLSLVGAGALGAASVRLEPMRPYFLALTGVLLAAGFYMTYRRPSPADCAAGGRCTPTSNRTAKVILWVATLIAALLVTFPYYVNWLI
jgi:mercuric ion transport protein